MSRVTVRTPIRRYRDGTFLSRPDTVAGEEPLEIRIDGSSISTTMRTPGADIELVHGLLHAEGMIAGREDVVAVRYCAGVDDSGQNTYNVLDVSMADPQAAARVTQPRAFVTGSACGVCGTASIQALQKISRYPSPAGPVFEPATIAALPDELHRRQQAFSTTGGVHGCALVSPDGSIMTVREDVGRHNAMDKVIGAAILAGELPIAGRAVLTSSRASFELVQKAVLAGVGMLIAVSAPSSLAVQLATETRLTLIGFTSARGFNIYSGAHRVAGSAG